MKTRSLTIALAVALLLSIAAVAQTAPPSVVNYQGVLRSATGAPLTGVYDLSFRIYDAPTGGNEYLIDLHTTAVGSPVTVTNGLFNVEIGGGSLLDGSGPGTYTSLPPVIQSTTNLYLEVVVGAEVLSPRVRLASAPSSLNAGALQGYAASAFTRGAANETLSGNWDNTANPWADNEVANTLTIAGGNINTTPIFLEQGTAPAATAEGRIQWDTDGDYLVVGTGASTATFFNSATISGLFQEDIASTSCPGGIASIADDGTITCASDDDTPDDDSEVPNALTIAGGNISVTPILLEQGTAPAATAEGRIQWDTDDDALVVGTGAATAIFRSATASDARYLRKDIADTAAGAITFAGVPTGSGVTQGSALVNPASATANYTLFGVGAAGVERFRVDAEGDARFSGDLALGTSTTGMAALNFYKAGTGDLYGFFGNVAHQNDAALRSVCGGYLSVSLPSGDLSMGTGLRTEVSGTSLSGNKFGAVHSVYGGGWANYGAVAEAVDGSGRVDNAYGLYGTANLTQATSNQGVGVFGRAASSTGAGLMMGVYGMASGGAMNWGLYTPDAAYVGGELSAPGGVNLSGGTAAAANTVDFGNGANDDLTAADVTDLTDGGATALHTHAAGDATTLDGIDSANFLRSDVADTADGDITFSSGHIGVGTGPVSWAGINQHMSISSSETSTGIYTYLSNYFLGTTGVYGAEFWGSSPTPMNTNLTCGVRAGADGAADGTGSHYGVWGSAKGGNGNHYGLYGIANQPTSSGTHYGVYGTATGGATNWGLYTPDSAYVGGKLSAPGGINLSGGTAGAATALDFGAGANDDLTATDVTDLTDGGTTTLHSHTNSSTLDGLDSTQFLRSDVADTAAGNITFSSGHIAVGTSTSGYVAINSALTLDTGVNSAAAQGLFTNSSTTATSSTTAWGGYFSATGSGAGSSISAVGIHAVGTGAADSDGPHTGVSGMAGGGNGTHYGVRGEANQTPSTGVHYGVYGSASGGSANWGLFTPDNLQFGDAVTDSHVFWGTLKSGSMSDTHKIIPFTANYGTIGLSTNHWWQMWAGTYYGKTTAIQAFDIYRDLDLLDAMQMVEHRDEKTGRTSLIFSPESLPPMIKGDPAVDGEGADQFVDLSKAIGFCFGSFRQMRQEVRGGLRGVQEQIEARTADPVTGNQAVAGSLSLQLDKDANDKARFSVFKDGGTAVAQELMRLDEEGNLHLKGALRPSALDLAEYHPLSAPASAGDVLVADRARTGFMRRCEMSSDKAVVGIVSTGPGVVLGSGIQRIAAAAPEMAEALEMARRVGDATEEARLWGELERRFAAGHAAIALSGTVPCKVDASYGAIEVGDLLVTSPTPGHAQRSDDPRPGTVVAKALEPLANGTGVIKVLVMLR